MEVDAFRDAALVFFIAIRAATTYGMQRISSNQRRTFDFTTQLTTDANLEHAMEVGFEGEWGLLNPRISKQAHEFATLLIRPPKDRVGQWKQQDWIQCYAPNVSGNSRPFRSTNNSVCQDFRRETCMILFILCIQCAGTCACSHLETDSYTFFSCVPDSQSPPETELRCCTTSLALRSVDALETSAQGFASAKNAQGFCVRATLRLRASVTEKATRGDAMPCTACRFFLRIGAFISSQRSIHE